MSNTHSLSKNSSRKYIALCLSFAGGCAFSCALAQQSQAQAQQPQQKQEHQKQEHHSVHRRPQNYQQPVYSTQAPASYDLPNYTANVIETKYLQLPGKNGPATQSTAIKTNDMPTQVISWYKSQLTQRGWTLHQPPPDPLAEKGKAFQLRADKDDNVLFMYVAHVHKVQPYTVINVAVRKKS
jgi:uncharacterized protein YdgA (DUF945 family)